MRRLGAFAVVGAIGFAVQIAAVAALTRFGRWPDALSTAAAVEAAVLHNFAWHWQWTWRDRAHCPAAFRAQLLRFHLVNGAASLAANVILATAFTRAGLDAVAANMIAVGVLSVVNFALADRWVFQRCPIARTT